MATGPLVLTGTAVIGSGAFTIADVNWDIQVTAMNLNI